MCSFSPARRPGLIPGLIGLCLWAVPLLYLAYSLWIIFFVTGHSYEALQEYYARNWPDAFDVGTVSKTCLTPAWYGFLATHKGLLVGSLSIVGLGYLAFSRSVLRFLRAGLSELAQGFRWLGETFRKCSTPERAGLLGLFGVLGLYWTYLFVNSPLFLDETCSFFHFAKQGFFFTIASYPVPNNHILLNVIAAWLYKLPFLTPALVMRLPNIAASLLLYYLLFCVFQRKGSFGRAMVVVAGVAFIHLLSYYTVQGRGYQLQLLLIAVNALSGWMYFFPWPGQSRETDRGGGRGHRRYGYYLFILSAILGFYVNPLFAYSFGAVLLVAGYRIVRGREWGKGLVLAGAVGVVVAAVGVLYLPIILGSSPQSIYDNKYVTASRPWSSLADGFRIFVYDIKYIFYYGYGSLVLVPLALIFSLAAYFRGRVRGFYYDYALYFLLASILSIAFLTVFKKIYPLERSLCFWVLALNIMFMNVCYDVVRQWTPRWAPLVLGLMLVVKTAGSVRLLYMDRFSIRNSVEGKLYYDPQPLFPQLIGLHPRSWQVTDSEDSYPMYLRLYLFTHGEKTPVIFSTDRALGDVILVADTAAGRIPLDGYTRWRDNKGRIEFDENNFGIYLSNALIGKQ